MNKFAKRRLRIKAFVLFAFLVTVFLVLDFKYRPIVKSVACNKAKMILSDAVNNSILDDIEAEPEAYQDTFIIKSNSDGSISAVVSNICKVNKLKARVNLLIQKKLAEFNGKKFKIPLGTLTGFELLNGRGPPILLEISASGSVVSELKSDFLSAGINQTLHRVCLHIRTHISVVIPGGSAVTDLDNETVISETVIVGRVPKICSGNVYTSSGET